jgi:hypothetical protein
MNRKPWQNKLFEEESLLVSVHSTVFLADKAQIPGINKVGSENVCQLS